MAKKRLLTPQEQDLKAEIWQFVLEHSDFFCSPMPDGLAFPRPGVIPDHYLHRPDEWQLDRLRVLTLKREKQIREEAVRASTASLGMAADTRRMLDSIRSLHAGGLSPEEIATQLQVLVIGVRNVLRLGNRPTIPRSTGPLSCRNWWRSGTAGGRNHPCVESIRMEPETDTKRVLFELEILGDREEHRCYLCHTSFGPIFVVGPPRSAVGRYACIAHVGDVADQWDQAA